MLQLLPPSPITNSIGNMQLTNAIKTLFFLAPLLAAAAPGPNEEDRERAAALHDRGLDAESLPFDLNKRACDYNGCKCLKGYAGVWCAQCKKGGSYVVQLLVSGGAIDHVYQCASDGDCCDYG